MKKRKKVIYIAGPITGVNNYWEPFEQMEDKLTDMGYVTLTPSYLPLGMTEARYMRICFAMIDSADAVLFLPGSDASRGACLERAYCEHVRKTIVRMNPLGGRWLENENGEEVEL